MQVLKPVGNRVLAEIDEVQGMSPGGILLPDSVKTKSKHKVGKIIAVGDGILTLDGKYVPIKAEVGDKVILADPENFGDLVVLNGKDYYIFEASSLLGILV